jgi:hypothetical protein
VQVLGQRLGQLDAEAVQADVVLIAGVHSRAKRNTTMKANIDVLAKLGEEGFDG